MRLKRYLIEKSFTQADIPRVFRVAMEWGYEDKQFETLKQLEKMQLKGLTGISDAGDLTFQWIGAGRDILLIMNGQELVDNNKISRFLYDNPHYMLSNNMKWLRRMYQRREGDDTPGILFNLNKEVFIVLARRGYITKYDIEYSAPYQTMASKHLVGNAKINGVKDYIKVFRKTYRTIAAKERKEDHWNTREFMRKAEKGETNIRGGFEEKFDKISDSEFASIVQEAFDEIKKVYGSEGEWVVKTKVLNIPKKSYLYIMEKFPKYRVKEFKENPDKPMDEWDKEGLIRWIKLMDGIDKKLKGKYVVKYISAKEFRRVQTIHFSKVKPIQM
jgi:hypothetical protein